MILSAIASKLKQRAKFDFRGRHYEAGLIVQAFSWYLRYPLSYRDIEASERHFKWPLMACLGRHRKAFHYRGSGRTHVAVR